MMRSGSCGTKGLNSWTVSTVGLSTMALTQETVVCAKAMDGLPVNLDRLWSDAMPVMGTENQTGKGDKVMKVGEFIEYLKTLPQKANVKVLVQYSAGYQGFDASFEDLSTDPYSGNIELIDMRDNPFAKGKPYENDVTLYLGET